MIELDDVIEIRNLGHDAFLEDKLRGIIESKGQTYRKVERPVTIEIITEPRKIPADPFDLFYSDGDAPNRVVPAGTMLIDGEYDISEEELHEKYEQLLDEKGNTIPGKYVKKTFITAVKNPFGKKIKDINGNGILLEEYDIDCYFIIDPISGKVDILSKENFEKQYASVSESKKDNLEEVSSNDKQSASETGINDVEKDDNAMFTSFEKNGKLYVFVNATEDELSQRKLIQQLEEWWKVNYGASNIPTYFYSIPGLGKGTKVIGEDEIVVSVDNNGNISVVNEDVVNKTENLHLEGTQGKPIHDETILLSKQDGQTNRQEYEEAQRAHDDVSKSTELLTEIEKISRARHFSDETKDELIREAENSSRTR